MQSTLKHHRTLLCSHSNSHINSPRNQLFKLDDPLSEVPWLSGHLIWTFGVICDFLLRGPYLPHSSESLSAAHHPVSVHRSALSFSCLQLFPHITSRDTLLFIYHLSFPCDKLALTPHGLQVKTKRLCLVLKALSEPTSAKPSDASPPFGSNWIY